MDAAWATVVAAIIGGATSISVAIITTRTSREAQLKEENALRTGESIIGASPDPARPRLARFLKGTAVGLVVVGHLLITFGIIYAFMGVLLEDVGREPPNVPHSRLVGALIAAFLTCLLTMCVIDLIRWLDRR